MISRSKEIALIFNRLSTRKSLLALLLLSLALPSSGVSVEQEQQEKPGVVEPNGLANGGAASSISSSANDSKRAAAGDEKTLSTAGIEQLVNQLGSNIFGERRSAFLELWKLGKTASSHIEDARTSSNVQVAQAATALMTLVRIGDDSFEPEVLELVLKPSAENLVALCRLGYWDLAQQSVDALMSDPATRSSLQDTSGTFYFNRLTQLALEQGDVTLVWPLVQRVQQVDAEAYDGSSLVLWLAERLGLDANSVDDSPDMSALEDYYQGDIDAALRQKISDPLRRKIVTRSARWSDLPDPDVQRLLLSDREGLSRRASRAVLLEFAGEFKKADAIWNELLSVTDQENPSGESEPDEDSDFQDGTSKDSTSQDDTSNDDGPKDGESGNESDAGNVTDAGDQRANESQPSGRDKAVLRLLKDAPGFEKNRILLALIITGQTRAVEAEILASSDSYQAFDWYAGSNDYAKIFDIVGLKTDLSNFEEWLLQVDGQLKNASRSRTGAGAQVFGRTARMANLLVGLGYRNEAERVLDLALDVADRNRTHVREVARWMTRAEPRSLMLDAIEPRFRRMTTDTNTTLWSILFPEMEQSTPELIKSMPPQLLTRRIGEADLRIENGRIPAGRVPGVMECLDHLYSWDVEFFEQWDTSIEEWLQLTKTRLTSRTSSRNGYTALLLRELAELARGCGYQDLAMEFALMRPTSGGSMASSATVAAEIFLTRGDADQAAQLLETVRAAGNYYNFQEALVLETQALLFAGRFEEALEVEQSRWLRALPTERFSNMSYSEVTQEFIDKAQYENAEQFGQTAFQMSTYGSSDCFGAAFDLSRIYEEQENLLESADALRAPLVEGLSPNSSLIDFHVKYRQLHLTWNIVKRERTHRAAACIEQGDYDAAKRHAEVGRALHPLDIEMVVACYPRLVKAGQQEFADELFLQYEAEMEKQLAAWPNDAMAFNNLAWMYSQCDRKLERAYELAQHGVSLAPSSAVYLDTLAEVHFRSGRIREAIEVMNQCVQMDPREIHYRKNLVRFAAKLDPE